MGRRSFRSAARNQVRPNGRKPSGAEVDVPGGPSSKGLPLARYWGDLHQLIRLQNLGALSGHLSHRFNNLLNSIAGYSTLALGKTGLPPELLQHLEIIKQTAHEAAELNQRFASLAGEGEGEEPAPVDVGQTLREILRFLSRLSKRKFRFDPHIDPDLPKVLARPTPLKQMLLALLSADRGDGEQGEPATLIAERTPSPAGAPDAWATLRIRRARPSVTHAPAGRGTTGAVPPYPPGFAALESVVRSLHGTLSCIQPIEGMEEIRVSLPGVVENQGNGAASPIRKGHSDSGGQTVLIVEDEVNLLDLTAMFLAQEGFHVLKAVDGREAVELHRAGSAEIRLTLLDVSLPGLTGPETWRAIRTINPAARFIFSSGYPETSASGTGADIPFLRKPYTLADLKKAVYSVLGRPYAFVP